MEKENRAFQLHTGRLIPVAVLCWLSVIAAVLGLFSFDLLAFQKMLFQTRFVTPNVIINAFLQFSLLSVMMLFWPGVLAICLTLSIANRPGFSILSRIVDISAKVIRIVRYVLIGYFVCQAIQNFLSYLHEDLAIYLIMAMVLFEGLFGVACYFFLQMMIKFFYHTADALTSLQYIHFSGKLDCCYTPALVNRVLILMGFLGISLAIYTYLYPFVNLFYPASLVLTAAANIVVSVLLKNCQSRISYEAYRIAKAKREAEST